MHKKTPPKTSLSFNMVSKLVSSSTSSLPTSSNINKNYSGMDSSSPYFVHHFIHLQFMLVLTRVNGVNYQSWSKSMIHALTAKNKIGFINGSIKPPSKIEQPTKFSLWNRCNSMILSWLTHSVELDLAKGVVHAKTTYQVWEDFKFQFSQKNAPAIYQIQRSLASLSQGTMIVLSYYMMSKVYEMSWKHIGLFSMVISSSHTCRKEKMIK